MREEVSFPEGSAVVNSLKAQSSFGRVSIPPGTCGREQPITARSRSPRSFIPPETCFREQQNLRFLITAGVFIPTGTCGTEQPPYQHRKCFIPPRTCGREQHASRSSRSSISPLGFIPPGTCGREQRHRFSRHLFPRFIPPGPAVENSFRSRSQAWKQFHSPRDLR
jgi:hypothetical protein